MSRLRRELGADAIRSAPAGYALGPASVDVVELLDAVRRGARAAEAGDDLAVEAALAPFLDRFRPPLEDLGESSFVTEARRTITDRFLAGVELYAAAAVRSGRADTVVGLLPDLVRAHPLRETLLEQLVLALGAVGRETEAIAAYSAGRERIAEELGVDPGTRLRSAYERVLRQDLPLQGAASVHRLRTAPRSRRTGPDRPRRGPGRADAPARPARDPARLPRRAGGHREVGSGRRGRPARGRRRRRLADARTPEELATAIVTRAVEPPPAGDPTAALIQVLRRRSRDAARARRCGAGRRHRGLDRRSARSGPGSAGARDGSPSAAGARGGAVPARRPRHARSGREPFAGGGPARGPDRARPGPRRAAWRSRSSSTRSRASATASRSHSSWPHRPAGCGRFRRSETRCSAPTDASGRTSDGDALAAAMRAGLADLPEDALAVLRAATCFLEGGDVRALVEVAGVGHDPGGAAVAELLDRGLLIARGRDRSPPPPRADPRRGADEDGRRSPPRRARGRDRLLRGPLLRPRVVRPPACDRRRARGRRDRAGQPANGARLRRRSAVAAAAAHRRAARVGRDPPLGRRDLAAMARHRPRDAGAVRRGPVRPARHRAGRPGGDRRGGGHRAAAPRPRTRGLAPIPAGQDRPRPRRRSQRLAMRSARSPRRRPPRRAAPPRSCAPGCSTRGRCSRCGSGSPRPRSS